MSLFNSFDNSFDAKETHYTVPLQAADKEIKSFEMTDKIMYPHLFMEMEGTLPEHKVRVLKNSLEELPYIRDTVPENYYDVILKSAGQVFIMGMIHTDNLKSLLQSSLFTNLEKSLWLSPTEVVKGNMMYAFCTSKMY